MKKKIAIWCENPFTVYSAKPIIEKYLQKGHEVVVYTEDVDIPIVKNYLNLPDSNIIGIKKYDNKLGRRLTLLFKILFIKQNFSIDYANRCKKKFSKLHLFLYALTFFMKVPNYKINKFYIKYMKFLYRLGIMKKNDIKADLLISFTKITQPEVLACITFNHISIMESWDHPMKDPYLMYPDYHFTWNKDLIDDTRNFQNLNKIRKIYPLKFRYIAERNEINDSELYKSIKKQSYINDLKYFDGKNVVLYPCMTASNWIGFNGEVKLISDIIEACKLAGYHLYLRPYPLGPADDYKMFEKSDKMLIGKYSTDIRGKDMLDEEYQTFRYLLIKKCDLVINVGTTFVFDSALLNKRILQLDLQTNKYEEFTSYSKGVHLKKYILNSYAIPYNGNIKKLTESINNVGYQYTNNIKNWVTVDAAQ